MTTKIRVEGITIETTGEHERFLIESAISLVATRHTTPIVSPLSADEVEIVREALGESDAKEIIEDFNARREAYEEGHPLPIKVSERTTATIGDAVGDKLAKVLVEQEPEHWHTGIKIGEDGVRRYKLYYKCPECQEKGRHYVELDTQYVRCRNCKTELVAQQANPDGAHERDQFGNFMTAFKKRWER